MKNIEDLELFWTKKAKDLLLNRKIVKVKYLSMKETKEIFGYERHRCLAFMLDNYVWIFPSQDDEGNGAGSLFTTSKDLPTIPVI